MAFVENVFIPIVKGVFLIGFILLFVVGLIIFLKRTFLTKRRRFWIKFHLLRRNYPEDQVKWCLDSIEDGYTMDDSLLLRKHLLTKTNFPMSKIDQMMFIFEEIFYKMEGGENNGRKIRPSRSENQIPKVSKRGQ